MGNESIGIYRKYASILYLHTQYRGASWMETTLQETYESIQNREKKKKKT